jgi:hypothetical protein
MEHHLEFWPVPLTERPQPRGRGEGVGGTFMGIICLPEMEKSSIFVNSWARGLAGERSGVTGGKETELGGKSCDP